MLWLQLFVPQSLSTKGDINKYNPESYIPFDNNNSQKKNGIQF